jgi:nitroreductase/dihydropteridine reductase
MWRYATKKMRGARVPTDKLAYILEAARLAPSSSGLQPYKILVISDPALLAKVKGVAREFEQKTPIRKSIQL